ncbi:uncharacterized protein LOC143287293 isoform X2 [Babylonia areolata]|uniref:uncharacterized protein LOC143287293 isoform X2 n=1 Tax=Babylonia areolata TaxID=304850 RepID=UPI003FD568EA
MAPVAKFMLPVVLLIVFGVMGAAQEQPTYVSPDKRHCFFCPPGTHVEEHCETHLTNSTCVRCPDHEYSDKPNSRTHCSLCKSSCPKDSLIITNCSILTNKECLCHEGFHRYPVDPIDDHWKCRPHSPCGEAEGEVYYGNHSHDTSCQKCQEGKQFVNRTHPVHPVCQNCAQCHPDDVVLTKCSLHADTQCGQPEKDTQSSASPSTSASTTATTAATPPVENKNDTSLSGGSIFGIVYAVLVVLGIIAEVAVYVFCHHHPNNTNLSQGDIYGIVFSVRTLIHHCRIRGGERRRNRWTLGRIVGLVFGVGILTAPILAYFAYRSNGSTSGQHSPRNASGHFGDDATSRETELNPLNRSNGIVDASLQQAGASPSAPEYPGDQQPQNGSAPDLPMAPQQGPGGEAAAPASGSVSAGAPNVRPQPDTANDEGIPAAERDIGSICSAPNVRPQQDTANDEGLTAAEWDIHFILSDVFRALSTRLGREWKMFLRALPGWSDIGKVDSLIEQKEMENNNNVKYTIDACLKEWYKECHDFVTKDNILNTLVKPGIGRWDLRNELSVS